ncbi:MAG: hypothetical protein ABIO06_09160 [Pseudolysinimonas sp.]
MRLVSVVAATAIVLGFALSGCSVITSLTQCAHGVDTADGAAKGLIDAARLAKTPTDICHWITPGMSVSQSQLDDLKKQFAHEPDTTLTIIVGEQMGSDVPISVTSNDGSVSEMFDGVADSHGKWTIAYGTPLAVDGPAEPSSVATALPTP